MKTKIIKTAVVLLLIFSFTLGGCWINCSATPPGRTEIYKDNNYISAYTPEQHIERISEIFETKYNEKYSEGYKLIKYDVYTVYSFDDKPEFFLMEMCWKNKQNVNKIEPFYSHMVGIIYHDQYYHATSPLMAFGIDLGDFGNGESIYNQLGLLESGRKLIFGIGPDSKHIYAYLDDGMVIGTEIEKYDYETWGHIEITYKELREIKPREFPEFVKREPFIAQDFCYVR